MAAGLKDLNKADILAAEDRPTEKVPVKEWGGAVTIRTLSGTEREEWQLSQVKMTVDKAGDLSRVPNIKGAQVRLVQMSIVDPATLEPLFSKTEVDALGDKSPVALDRVFKAAIALNGLDEGAVEEAGKDSETTPSDEPGTD